LGSEIAISSKISCVLSTSFAPDRISAWQPRVSGLWMESGDGEHFASLIDRELWP